MSESSHKLFLLKKKGVQFKKTIRISGFTIAELIVVITILAILGTIGFISLSGYSSDAAETKTKSNLRALHTAITSESSASGNSPRWYIAHDAGSALPDGTIATVGGSSVTLKGGNSGVAPLDSNYTSGSPKWSAIKLNKEKFRTSESLKFWGFGENASALSQNGEPTIAALDASIQYSGGRTRSFSYVQSAAVLPNSGKAVVIGDFPVPSASEAGILKGLILDPKTTNEALVNEATTSPGTVIAGGPRMLKDIYVGTEGAYPEFATSLNGITIFAAGTEANGVELWKSDGTEAGTSMIKDINPGAISSSPWGTAVYGPDVFTFEMKTHNGFTYFSAITPAHGKELWKTDGTEAGTVMVKDIWNGTGSSIPRYFHVYNNQLYFSANNGTNGDELWKTDGTEAGTVMVKDIWAGSAGGLQTTVGMYNFGGSLYVGAKIGTSSGSLWKTDGTTAGTTMVKDFAMPVGWGSTPVTFFEAGGSLFFKTTVSTNGNELWKTDGTTAGTTMFKEFWIGSNGGDPRRPTAYNGEIYFSSADGTYGRELWKTNGTLAGTVMVKDINTGTANSDPEEMTVLNGQLYFTAKNATGGREIWKSDGTEAGTVTLKDIKPGASDSWPYDFMNVNGKIYFYADDGTNGIEIWETDGTTDGTKMLMDINPGPSGSDGWAPYAARNASMFGNTLYFMADDGVHGMEMWVYQTSN